MSEFLQHLAFDPSRPLNFASLFFWGYFAVVLVGFSLIHKRLAWRNAYLFLVSIYFYYKTSYFFFFLLLFSTGVDYTLARWMQNTARQPLRVALVTASVAVNLFVLFYFKYVYFFADAIKDLAGIDWRPIPHYALWSNAHFGTDFPIDRIALPVGISFYTFQCISYTVDVYRRQIQAVKNPLDFGFYISFFPQLVAGPIVRASDFIPQLYQPYNVDRKTFGLGLFWVLNGLLKKVFLADYLAVNFIDRVFAQPTLYSGVETMLALFGYSLQVYADFSGYTDVAIGLALWMGFSLTKNFNSPYKAANVGEFWQRWHMSLSGWLKDYVYIPLGGNRKGFAHTQINILLAMVISGLWHGANSTFIVWGTLHGLGVVFVNLYDKILGKDQAMPVALARFFTLSYIALAWVFFRADTNEAALQLLSALANGLGTPEFQHGLLAAFVIIFFLLSAQAQRLEQACVQRLTELGWIALTCLVSGLAFMAILLGPNGVPSFIYYRF